MSHNKVIHRLTTCKSEVGVAGALAVRATTKRKEVQRLSQLLERDLFLELQLAFWS